MKKKIKKDYFYISVIISFVIQILIKVVGMVYNVYLTNNELYADAGNGIFMSAHQIYILFLTVSIVGIPTSISRIISSRSKNNVDIQKIVNISLMIWGLIGILEMFILFLLSKNIAINILGNVQTEYILKILAIGIPFVNFNSVYRGALNGIEKTSEGTIIQFVEQLIKVFFTIFCINWIRKNNIETQNNILYVVTFGVTISVVLTFFIYLNKWKKYKNNIIEEANIRYIEIIKNVFTLSIPITIIGIFGSINKNIDSISLRLILKDVFDSNIINEKYGILISKVDVLTNLPIGLNSAITIPLLPKIAKMYSYNDYEGIKKMISSSLFISLSFAIPITLCFFLYADNILGILYPNAIEGASQLRISSILIVLNMVLQIVMVYYNAIGKTKVIIHSFSIGAILKLILNIILVRINNLYEKGIIISSIVSDIIILSILICNKLFKTINLKLTDLKINNILFESLFMIFIIMIIENIGEHFNIKDNILFVLGGRNGCNFLYFQIFL